MGSGVARGRRENGSQRWRPRREVTEAAGVERAAAPQVTGPGPRRRGRVIAGLYRGNVACDEGGGLGNPTETR